MRGGTAVLAAAAVVLAGCSAAPSTPAAPAASSTAAGDRSVTGALLQYRRDELARRLQVRLTAHEPGLVVEQLTFDTSGWPAAAATPNEAALPDGTALDFPVVLGTADCDGPPGTAEAEVVVRDPTGGTRTLDVPLDDDGLVRRLHAEDCADEALRAQVAIEVAGVAPVDEHSVQVTVRLRRLSGDDAVRVTGTRPNTVYDLSTDGRLPTLRHGGGEVSFDVTMVAARCDVHALGESYRTGIIGLVLALGDGDPRPYDLVPAPDVRARLETFAVTSCRGG
ncbi:hypothetical protein [Petropleomorpha daqingensis]|uniref:Lipoprotein n=1 Tax=Petropleomorpha daqingensis TaxID=2026353 RepID=A0A853CFZ8_9ACTN|nr:hypothetical protein [Petropleomorpha daqingensis]NYJ06116.1 hypothetical protein [Petropleomorpha daqingensis]